MIMNILPYSSVHFDDCQKILRSNIPDYIDPCEESKFVNYLSTAKIIYFILVDSERLIACGGYGFNNKTQACTLSWGVVHNEFHNKGYGTQLLTYRLKHIKKRYGDIDVELDTSQKTYQFYEKFNFKVKKITYDFYGEGLDRYDMRLSN